MICHLSKCQKDLHMMRFKNGEVNFELTYMNVIKTAQKHISGTFKGFGTHHM